MTLTQLEILALRTQSALTAQGSRHGAAAFAAFASIIHEYAAQESKDGACPHSVTTSGPKAQCVKCGTHMEGLRT